MKLLALDFEGYYDKDVTLKKLNIMEYVNHPKFKITGVATQFIDLDNLEAEKLKIFMGVNSADWYSEDEVQDHLESIDWEDTAVLCHHTDFDAYILSQKYGIKPKFHYDTMAMSRGKWPGKSSSLAALVERLFPDRPAIRKGNELASAKGIESYSPELDQIIGNYARNDVHVMVAAFAEMFPDYPKSELQIIDIVCRMFTQPKFVLDRDMTTKHRDDAKLNSTTKVAASGITKEVLGSSDQFVAYMKATYNIDIPMKQGKNKLIPALGKNDIAFQNLQKQYPEHKAIWDARIASKSRIDETRATRFLNGTNRDGTISMPLKYYAAHTGRFGGGEKMNPQNLKRGSNLRKALCAPEGYMVVVVDKSQIEARLTAWLAGCDKLVQAFREKRDVYSEFASSIYNRIITKADVVQRFVGKTCTLGLGFGTGANKLQVTLESGSQGPVVIIDEQEAKRIVTKYRTEYFEIPRLWKKLEEIFVWIQNPKFFGQTYGPLTAKKDGFILPSGMVMNYPEAEGLSFYDARFKMRKKLWGGVLTENCLAEDTEVLTSNGWKKIQLISTNDLVHDGIDWVSSGGSIFKSVQECIELDGVQMTPDHEVLTNDGWLPAEAVSEPFRPDIRISNSNSAGADQRTETIVGVSLQMRDTSNPHGDRGLEISKERADTELRMPGRDTCNYTRNEPTSGVLGVEINERPLSPSNTSGMAQLRSSWNQGLQTVGTKFRKLLGGYGANLRSWFGFRSSKQQRKLYSGQLSMDLAASQRLEQTELSSNTRTLGRSQETRDRKINTVLSDPPQLAERTVARTSRKVYDILNCGPRHRFVVKGANGPFIVHNCIQALARTDICSNMCAIDTWFKANPHMDGMVSLQIHDEIICIVKEQYAQQTYDKMLSVMTTPPSWAPDLPLAGEGGFAKEYSK